VFFVALFAVYFIYNTAQRLTARLLAEVKRGFLMRTLAAAFLAGLIGLLPAIAGAQAPTAANTLKSNTRVITVDVVVTDSHGNTVRGLNQDDFQILEKPGGQQKIARFEFFDMHANQPRATSNSQSSAAPHVFSNLSTAVAGMPPTVMLLDGLNTPTVQQMQVRRDMILFLENLPENTPVAVFVLGHTVRVLQNFTTDRTLLRAAAKQAGSPTTIDQYPQDDPNSASNMMKELDPRAPESIIKGLEDFEKEEYSAMIDQRVDETADAMTAIAKFLRGYPGRKNLLWFSEAFPLWIEPNTEFGSDSLKGANSHDGKVRAAAEALTDAGVAVYPVDARGLKASQSYSAASDIEIDRQNPGRSFAGTLSRENALRVESQATMEEVADKTGGEVCKNTNDLTGCVRRALDESSAYYELSYYPANVKWDNRFHKITIKTPRRGIKMAYRRGYFATDIAALAKHEKSEDVLMDVCRDPLPSTSIGLSAVALPPEKSASQPAGARYLLAISPSALTLAPGSGSRRLDARMAICEFNPKGDKFKFFSRDLSRTVPEAVYQAWQSHGIGDIFDFDAKADDQRLRFAVLDVPSGSAGSLDVPAHPTEFASIPRPAAVAPPVPRADEDAPTPGSPAATPQASTPAASAPAGTSQQEVTTGLIFRSNLGKISRLDWNHGKVSYHGDLGVDVGAIAFFQKLIGVRYHCQTGSLAPNDANSPAAPILAFVFPSLAGPAATVDLNGNEPQFSGDLPVDPDAKLFFEQVWKLCHCQQP
jgi:VWFA-related protein